MKKFFISRNEKTTGPFEESKLKELFESGKLLPSDQLWEEANSESTETVSDYFNLGKQKPNLKTGQAAIIRTNETVGDFVYIEMNGKTQGPFTKSRAIELFENGKLALDDQICEAKSGAEWKTVKDYLNIPSPSKSNKQKKPKNSTNTNKQSIVNNVIVKTGSDSSEHGFRGLAFLLELFLTPATLFLVGGIGPLMVGATYISLIIGIFGFFTGLLFFFLTGGFSVFISLPLFIIKWITDLVITLTFKPNQD